MWCVLFRIVLLHMVHTHPVPILSSPQSVLILYSMLIQYCKYWIAWQWTVLQLVSTALDLYCTESCTIDQDCNYTIRYQGLQSLPNQYRILEHGSRDFLDTARKEVGVLWFSPLPCNSKLASITRVSHNVIIFLSLVCRFFLFCFFMAQLLNLHMQPAISESTWIVNSRS